MTVTVNHPLRLFAAALAIAAPVAATPHAQAQESRDSMVLGGIPSFADLADLADPAGIVARVKITRTARLKPEQAPGVPAGWARVLVTAKTENLLVGAQLGESVRYLADIRLDERGKLPKLNKKSVLVFANPVAGAPGELRLVSPRAQILADPATEQRTRALLAQLVAPGAAPRLTGIREAIHVPGNLAGEGETQVFMATDGGAPVSITIVRRPGQPVVWGVSLTEIVDQAARPPARDTLTWYRLACTLPPELPREVNQFGSAEHRRIAAEDYRMVIGQLGACTRNRI